MKAKTQKETQKMSAQKKEESKVLPECQARFNYLDKALDKIEKKLNNGISEQVAKLAKTTDILNKSVERFMKILEALQNDNNDIRNYIRNSNRLYGTRLDSLDEKVKKIDKDIKEKFKAVEEVKHWKRALAIAIGIFAGLSVLLKFVESWLAKLQ